LAANERRNDAFKQKRAVVSIFSGKFYLGLLTAKVERVVLNALAKVIAPCGLITAPLAVPFAIAFGEVDPPLARHGGTLAPATPQRVGKTHRGFAA
jgi:hypothetical protein